MNNTICVFPYQSTLDIFELNTEHLTVEVVEKETVDTKHFSSTLGLMKYFNKNK